MSSPIVLILGAGANIGQATARKFNANGYKVALASRTGGATAATKDDEEVNVFSFKADFINPENIKPLYEKVVATVGIPNVVIYNVAHKFISPEPFALPLESFQETINVNTNSSYAAAHEAVKGFEKLPESLPKSFIFTGNALNAMSMPPLANLGAGKSASAHLIEAAAAAYQKKGYTFYYVDERLDGGRPAGDGIDGPAHADIFYELANNKRQRHWDQTFIKGKGYIKF